MRIIAIREMPKFSMISSMVVAFIITVSLLSNTVISFRISSIKTSSIHSRKTTSFGVDRRTLLHSEQGEGSEEGIVTDANDQGKKIEEMMKLFVTAIDEGRQDELVKAGLKVTTLSARAALDEKLNDPEIIANILGPMSSQEERSLKSELANQIAKELELENSNSSFGSSSSGAEGYEESDLDPLIFAELQAEARETLEVQYWMI